MGVPLESRSRATTRHARCTGYDPRQPRSKTPVSPPEELAALRFAATALALRSEDSTTMEDAVDGLRKYGGLGADEPTRTVAELSLDRNVRTIFTAILERRPVGFTYGAETRKGAPAAGSPAAPALVPALSPRRRGTLTHLPTRPDRGHGAPLEGEDDRRHRTGGAAPAARRASAPVEAVGRIPAVPALGVRRG
ncbi:MAG: hypothetical protein R2789_07905 [Microthrixaceae bacterium]